MWSIFALFTGIITDVGRIVAIDKKPNGLHIAIECAYPPEVTMLGASIACNGACMTVTEMENCAVGSRFSFDVSDASLAVTQLSHWRVGDAVNLEKALCLGDELGGHMVSGHVDGVAEVKIYEKLSDNVLLGVEVSENLAGFVAEKGSITLNGVSLTVNRVEGCLAVVNLIPHTLAHTNFGKVEEGDFLNVEIDLLARYTARMLEYNKR